MRVLVSVASRHGATDELGGVIARVLEGECLDVDRVDPEHVPSVAPYDGVVLGSAVYAGRWLAPARDLVDRELAHLRERPVWLLSSGPIGDPSKPTTAPAEALAISDLIGAREHRVFEGRLDPARLGFAETVMASSIRAESGDFRRWDAVIDWARAIAAGVTAASLTPGLA
jgi:menaquinone-dependent protoporphyrinogen oxidase